MVYLRCIKPLCELLDCGVASIVDSALDALLAILLVGAMMKKKTRFRLYALLFKKAGGMQQVAKLCQDADAIHGQAKKINKILQRKK